MATADQIMDLGHSLAEDLLKLGRDNGILPGDLVQGLSVAQRLLQSVLYPGQTLDGVQAEMEGEATYVASSRTLGVN